MSTSGKSTFKLEETTNSISFNLEEEFAGNGMAKNGGIEFSAGHVGADLVFVHIGNFRPDAVIDKSVIELGICLFDG